VRTRRGLVASGLVAALAAAVGSANLARAKLAGWVGQASSRGDNAHDPAASALGTPAACAQYGGVPSGFGGDRHAGMVRVVGGRFEMGSRHGYADERPAGQVAVEGFWIDRTEVTNAQFTAFVRATSYVTLPEREGGAAVFTPPAEDELGDEGMSWWRFERGASWRHPEGPASDLAGRDNQPVVQVTARDAAAYAAWLDHELPTEAQWEYAARAGLPDDRSKGAPRDAAGHPTANYWQGSFPAHDTHEDGYEGRAPVGCFPANAFGLHDVIGNVWEWTRDRYEGHVEGHCPSHAAAPTGGTPTVVKGGSFLCSANFCSRYRAAARYPQEANLATGHVGFRTVTTL
jgi:formylglycine-generating enzyme